MKALSLRWQVVILVLASVFAAQVIGFSLLLLSPPDEPPRMSVDQVLLALQAHPNAPDVPGLRRERRPEPPFQGGRDEFAVSVAAALAESLGSAPASVRVRATRSLAGPDKLQAYRITLVGPDGGQAVASSRVRARLLRRLPLPPFEAALRSADGEWIVVGPDRPLLTPWRARVLLSFGLSVLLLTPLAWWSARRLTRPVRLFSDAAERLGLDPRAAPLAVDGPKEVRVAAASFNRMQERLGQYVEGRTAMMAAIAHDLRTPLTGLRLWAESAPSPQRQRMAQEMDRMEAMIAQVLTFARGEQVRERRTLLDLKQLATSCVQEIAARGVPLAAQVTEALPVQGEPINLRRALLNLLENAVAFAGGGELTAMRQGDMALLTVADRGPGIPPADLQRVFEPFARLEPSRSRTTGGVGLGLALARSVALAHGGSLTLRNREGGGLAAILALPLAPTPQSGAARRID